MFTINAVTNCPYTRTSTAIVHIPHALLAEFAGAVDDNLEWLCLLKGIRSTDGFTITVTGIETPLQYRSAVVCGLQEEAEIDSTVVGVLHSHHDMSAYFSATDRATLNTRFPLSIVIAQPSQLNTTANTFGFSYKAEAKVVLPCGSIGTVSAVIAPDPVPLHWCYPIAATIVADKKPLGNCDQFVTKTDGQTDSQADQTGMTVQEAKCKESRAVFPKLYFGKAGAELLAEIQKKGVVQPDKTLFTEYGKETETTWTRKERRILCESDFGNRLVGKVKKKLKHGYKLKGLFDPDEVYERPYERPYEKQYEQTDGVLIPQRLCISCKQTRYDYGRDQKWSTFIYYFLDGTGVCRDCSKY